MNITDTAAKLIIARTEVYLADMGRTGSFGGFPTLSEATDSLTDEALKEWAEVSGEGARKGKTDGASGRYLYALELLGWDNVAQTLMELCVAVYMYPEFDAYLVSNFGYGPCLHLAALIEGRDGLSHTEIHDYASRVRRILRLDLMSEPLQYAEVSADERLMGFLDCNDDVSLKLADFTTLFRWNDESLHEPYVNKALIERGTEHFANGGSVLCLAGRGGRRFIAKHIAREMKTDFLFVNIAGLIRKAEKDNIAPLRDVLIREAYYGKAGICLYGFDEHFITGGTSDRERGRRDMETLSGMLFAPLTGEGIPLVVCVDEISMMPGRDVIGGLKCISLPESYDYDERKKLWQGLFEACGLEMDPASFASRYRMDPNEAARTVADYMQKPREDEQDITEEERFARISIDSIRNNESGTGRIIYPDVRLDDVKLKDNVKNVLRDAVNAVLSGPVVLDEWDLRKRYPYGRGVSLLMAGPPGTGKTMSANAIAGELSLPLYQVNLSNTVDKYIGETEKNLEKAFSFAEKNNVILFFDEADALFGTRSEVHDSKDRYANTEISYLLQRMEAYDGIVIMATNIKGNIDPAFMRRIRFVAHFENPDEEMRRAIWEGCITDSVPHEEIDIAYLATQFDKFTGSVIKTVFLNACAKAAGEDEKLGMKHLIYAIKQETEKESPVGFTMETLGKYAYLI
jgi:AAA+ superfamily predicted ATPase